MAGGRMARDQGAGAGPIGSELASILPPERLGRDIPMSLHTSFRIGGPADFLATVESPVELAAVLGVCTRHGIFPLFLGRGTNLLVRDGGIRGVVLRLGGQYAEARFDGLEVVAGAAAGLGDLARECGRRGLSGLEFAVGIPGSVGGAVIMNAGAYDSEMSKVVTWAEVVRTNTKDQKAQAFDIERIPAAELGFGYRTSRPQQEGWPVTAAGLRLTVGDPVAIQALEDDYTARRRAKQPLDLPSAGSVFKRPPGHFAGALIDEARCRGLRVGDAQVSELHAGFIVNLGSATARDVLGLIAEVQERVLAATGVSLQPEIRIVGEDLR